MIRQVIYQFLFQFGNYILPLLILPFLIEKLSPEVYTSLVFLQSTTLVLIVILNYGIELTGTRFVANNIEDKGTIAEYIFSVFALRSFLFIVLVPILYFSINIFTEFNGYIFICVVIWLSSYIIQIGWYFQAIGQFGTLSKEGLLPKIVIMPLVFVFLNGDDNVYIYLLLLGVSNYICNLLMIIKCTLFLHQKVKVSSNVLLSVLRLLKDGKSVFLSQLNVIFVNQANSLILPFVLNPADFVLFNTAERLIKVLSMLSAPLTTVLYSSINRGEVKKEDVFLKVSNLIKYSIFLFGVGGLFYYYLVPQLMLLIFPKLGLDLFYWVGIMLPIPLMIFFNNLFGTQIGLTFEKDKAFSRVVLVGGACSILLCGCFAWFLGISGAVIATYISQMVILFGMYFIAKSCGFTYGT
ncbi:TPA: oligosaccharide flippase family protein [Vibrio diabolicus]